MSTDLNPKIPSLHASDTPDATLDIPQLVAEVYADAPAVLRVSLLEQLLKPMGVLPLAIVANGIFATIRFNNGWPDMHLRFEDVRNVQPKDVAALVERVQQVSLSSFDGLTRILTSSPLITSSAAAAILLATLMKMSRNRRESDNRHSARTDG
ncbi:hypothetical protein LHU53_12035 [Rhodoferax sp. U2-2l]|uniref:hypothetical protein n=1 Tax=Rhodoferax sp. U2-2l TaxID=2884000 RepID=UPI001D0B7766|nr:hypothetical protein [Rhodoferax sp. U2-2l]MCB8747634.1 hypothetical protein [Rhodoferax sp. U2-2l]